ncbi:MAG: globin [Chloroflexota bacterium]
MSQNEITVYERVGGEDTFRQLVDIFYAKVEADEILRSIFPDDLEPGKKWQFLFLSQYWGGPTTYSAERGHPRLRMRHGPYPITPDMRNRWLQYMLEAVDEVGIQDPDRAIMREYFQRAASAMINRFEPPSSS